MTLLAHQRILTRLPASQCTLMNSLVLPLMNDIPTAPAFILSLLSPADNAVFVPIE